MPAEEPDSPVAAAELGIEGGPTDLDILFQGVEAIRQPDIDIDHHGPWTNGTEGALGQWYGMIAKGPVELLVKQDLFFPEARLVAKGICHINSALYEAAP